MTDTDRSLTGKTTNVSVQTLVAEVRTLVVGSRQVTMSVYNQLDDCPPVRIQPMGRVRPPREDGSLVHVVGVDPDTGSLARSSHTASYVWERKEVADVEHATYAQIAATLRENHLAVPDFELKTCAAALRRAGKEAAADALPASVTAAQDAAREAFRKKWARDISLIGEWEALPLIVLAGLR